VEVVGATEGREISRHVVCERASQRAFFGVSALLFAASAAVTCPSARAVRLFGISSRGMTLETVERISLRSTNAIISEAILARSSCCRQNCGS
jgi:hypothetical protein